MAGALFTDGGGVGSCTFAGWPPPPRLLRFGGRSERPVGAFVGGGLATVGDGVCCRGFPETFAGGKLESAVAARPGGAWRTRDRSAELFPGRSVSISFPASGWPGCAASFACCRSNGTGGGGGGVFATIVRSITLAGGCAARFPPPADGPRTLFLVGATSALRLTGADVISCGFTTTAPLPTW